MIHSLGDLKKKEDRKEDRKASDFYAGGQKSGLSVQSPDDVEGMLNRARQGAGAQEPAQPGEITINVTLYANGFTVDDGPFRDYEAPENKRFIAEMNQNRVPGELFAKTKGKPVSVNLSDKRTERYVPPPPPKYVAFSGEGQRMSGSTSSVPAGTVDMNAPGPHHDPAQPTTTVQIRFHNGQRKQVTVNLTTRVAALHDYVMMAAPIDGEYQLLSGFPPKPLLNPSQTVQEAGVANGAVIQKLL